MLSRALDVTGYVCDAYDTQRITQASRRGLKRTFDIALWLDMYKPNLKLS